MAPLWMVDIRPSTGFSSLEVGFVSLVVFFILCIILVTLCAQCERKPTNTYDMRGTTQTDGAVGPNGAVSGGAGFDSSLNWRSHKDMPEPTISTMERNRAATK